MLRITALSVSLLFLSLPATAASNKCANAQDQATMTQCAGEDFSAADKKLNASFKEIQKRLADDADGKKLFVKAQRAWIAFRDAECAFTTADASGGSIYPMLVASCKTDLTKQRNEQFQKYLSCEEGDTSCPVPAAN
ncbi:lysozyme inhibitor LprI family protein [Ochrobactrum sp. RH2CCR150]|uniref:lysozyme inhibitor LprI family protein n=1 Tax=Ochrobactrum sp. RH2CCR150 TaxID=2587044 RepID=UPI0015FA3953|nr:uncharacterized protein YecT (DUF1311 family) [Ochrobactrum sp. RH2CCR150]